MKIKNAIADVFCAVLKSVFSTLSPHNRHLMTGKLFDTLDNTVIFYERFGKLMFYYNSSDSYMPTLHYKDRDEKLIEWLDSLIPGSVLYEIGANIGTYSIYAAKSGKIKVIAFEPLSLNYYILNKNIELNGVDDQVKAFCLAIGDKNMPVGFHLPKDLMGNVFPSFDLLSGQKNNSSDYFDHAGFSITLDEFIYDYGMDFPDYLKIDVDGGEDKVIRGAEKTLSDQRLKEIYIEISTHDETFYKSVTNPIETAGFELIRKDDSLNSDHYYRRKQ